MSEMTHSPNTTIELWEPPCAVCGAPLGYRVRRDYYGAKTKCEVCVSSVTSTRLSASGLPIDFADGTHSLLTLQPRNEYCISALAAAQAFLTLGQKPARPILFLTGPKGTGKTHIAAGIVAAWIGRGGIARFRTWERILTEITASYGDHSTDDLVEFFCSVPLLAIDDVGLEKPTEGKVEKLYSILNERINQRRATVLTSMYGNAELGRRLASNLPDNAVVEAILDRIRGFATVVKMDGESYRKQLALGVE